MVGPWGVVTRRGSWASGSDCCVSDRDGQQPGTAECQVCTPVHTHFIYPPMPYAQVRSSLEAALEALPPVTRFALITMSNRVRGAVCVCGGGEGGIETSPNYTEPNAKERGGDWA